MTIRVIIENAADSKADLKVAHITESKEEFSEYLRPGQSASKYVYDMRSLLLSEGRDPARDQTIDAPQSHNDEASAR
jgi:hypothetical protein